MKFLDIPLLRATLAFAALIGVLAALALLLSPLLVPILLSFVLYALLSPAVSLMVRAGVGHTWAIVVVLLGVMALVSGGLLVAVPALTYQLAEFQQRVPAMWNEVLALSASVEQWVASHTALKIDTASFTTSVLDRLKNGGVEAIKSITGALANIASILVLVPILTFFLLRDLRAIRNGLMDLLPNRAFELGWHIYGQVVDKLDSYIRGVMIQSGVIAAITTVGFAFIGLELSGLLGLLTGILNVIPYVGPLLSMIPPALLVLAGSPPDMWLLLGQSVGVILFAQLADNAVIVPTLIAQAADLHPLTVLGGIVIMGYMFGFLGMILAIPLLFSGKIIFLGLLKGLSGESRAGTVS